MASASTGLSENPSTTGSLVWSLAGETGSSSEDQDHERCRLKFGGSSLKGAECLRQVYEIILEHLSKRPVVVVSAMGDTTNKLLRALERARAETADCSDEEVDKLVREHQAIMKELGMEPAADVQSLFNELKKILKAVHVLKEVSGRTRDKVVSFGERISARTVAYVFNNIHRGAFPLKLGSGRTQASQIANLAAAQCERCGAPACNLRPAFCSWDCALEHSQVTNAADVHLVLLKALEDARHELAHELHPGLLAATIEERLEDGIELFRAQGVEPTQAQLAAIVDKILQPLRETVDCVVERIFQMEKMVPKAVAFDAWDIGICTTCCCGSEKSADSEAEILPEAIQNIEQQLKHLESNYTQVPIVTGCSMLGFSAFSQRMPARRWQRHIYHAA